MKCVINSLFTVIDRNFPAVNNNRVYSLYTCCKKETFTSTTTYVSNKD